MDSSEKDLGLEPVHYKTKRKGWTPSPSPRGPPTQDVTPTKGPREPDLRTEEIGEVTYSFRGVRKNEFSCTEPKTKDVDFQRTRSPRSQSYVGASESRVGTLQSRD